MAKYTLKFNLSFFLSKCEQFHYPDPLSYSKRMSRIVDPCIISCESRAVHMSRLLRAQVLYFKCRCAASAAIIDDFSNMHTVGQHKRLSLAREEGDPTK